VCHAACLISAIRADRCAVRRPPDWRSGRALWVSSTGTSGLPENERIMAPHTPYLRAGRQITPSRMCGPGSARLGSAASLLGRLTPLLQLLKADLHNV
jgi:hypothetical protein